MMKKCIKGAAVALVVLAVAQCTILNTQLFAKDEVVATSEKAGKPYTITTEVADSASTRKFVISNLTASSLTVNYSTNLDNTNQSVVIAANAKTIITVTAGNANGVTLYAEADDQYFTLNSYNGYYMPVNYYVDGAVVSSTTTLNTLENGGVWTAPKATVINGQRYVISGSNYKTAKFRDSELAFQYVLENRTPFKSYVNYVDQDGTRLNADKSISFNVTEDGGSFTPAASYTAANGSSYKLMAGQSNVSQSYEEGSKVYTYRYQKTENEAARPYLITIIYKTASGDVLGSKTQTVTQGSSVNFETASKIVDGNGVEYARASGEPAAIKHEFENSKRTYTVVYEIAKAEKPYDITIQYIDLLTGRTLDSTTQNVGLNKTVRFNADQTINADGKTYVLSADQNKTITHSFGTAQRVYTVYYNEKDKDVTSYKVSVLYFDATNNKVLYSTEQEAVLGSALTISAPTNYTANGTDFVMLAGQQDMTHDFYSARRRYVFFYRDVNDAANEDTVVDNKPNGDQEIVNPDDGPIINVDNRGNVTIPGGGPNGEDLIIDDNDDVIIDDNETPNSNGQEDSKDDEEEILDNETPQAKGEKQNTTLLAIAGTGIGLALLGCVIAIIIIKKKRSEKPASKE